jgi:hypothetical protein
MEGRINAVRADKKINVPVVMIRAAVAAVISLLDGTAQLVAKLLYRNELRIMEAMRLRGMTRSTGPMRWLGSIQIQPRTGCGSMSSPPGTSL